jgi:hypothetical protein
MDIYLEQPKENIPWIILYDLDGSPMNTNGKVPRAVIRVIAVQTKCIVFIIILRNRYCLST